MFSPWVDPEEEADCAVAMEMGAFFFFEDLEEGDSLEREAGWSAVVATLLIPLAAMTVPAGCVWLVICAGRQCVPTEIGCGTANVLGTCTVDCRVIGVGTRTWT